MPLDDNDGWVSKTLTTSAQETFFKAARDRQENQEKDAETIRRDRNLFCAAFATFGLLGFGFALTTFIRQPVPEPPRWVIIHDGSGIVEPGVPQKDAPKLFNENARQRAMWDFLTACEGYVPEVWAKLNWHACMVMATSEEQHRREAEIGKGGTRYPPAVFGLTGWAMPTASVANPPKFIPLEVVGVAPNQIFHYKVRYERTEVAYGKETRPHWTADFYFSFHPDLNMTPDDRLLNQSGFQVSSFSTTPD